MSDLCPFRVNYKNPSSLDRNSNSRINLLILVAPNYKDYSFNLNTASFSGGFQKYNRGSLTLLPCSDSRNVLVVSNAMRVASSIGYPYIPVEMDGKA